MAAISEARASSYTSLLPSMQTAVQLYESLGFVHREPYFGSPVAGNVFMELKLGM